MTTYERFARVNVLCHEPFVAICCWKSFRVRPPLKQNFSFKEGMNSVLSQKHSWLCTSINILRRDHFLVHTKNMKKNIIIPGLPNWATFQRRLSGMEKNIHISLKRQCEFFFKYKNVSYFVKQHRPPASQRPWKLRPRNLLMTRKALPNHRAKVCERDHSLTKISPFVTALSNSIMLWQHCYEWITLMILQYCSSLFQKCLSTLIKQLLLAFVRISKICIDWTTTAHSPFLTR